LKTLTKKLLALIVCLIMVIYIAACSSPAGENKPDAKQATASPTSNATATSAKKEPVKLRFTFWGSPKEKKAVEDAIASFEKKYDWVKVESIYIPTAEFLTKLNAMIAGGEAPDLSYSQAWNLKMGEDGLIYNFNDLIKNDPTIKAGDFLKYGWWNWAPDKSAGPYQSAVTPTLMYNAEIFEKSGLSMPPTKAENAWNWDQFVEVAKKLTIDQNGKNAADPGFDPAKIAQYGVQFSTAWSSYMPMVLSNGGDYLTPDGKEFGLSKPEATDAIQKIADLINVYHVSPSPVQASSLPAPATALQSKKVAMVVDGSFNHLDLSQAGFKWGVGVLPKIKTYKTFFYGGTLIIFKSTKHLDETYLLYKWITDPENVLTMHQGLWMPQLTKWYEDPKLIDKWANETLPGRPKGFQDAVMRSTFENAVPAARNNVKNFLEIDAQVAAALDQVWLGKKSAEQAMKGIEEKVKPLVQGTYLK
jgi:multiple sugar transport system substrate-binding protein